MKISAIKRFMKPFFMYFCKKRTIIRKALMPASIPKILLLAMVLALLSCGTNDTENDPVVKLTIDWRQRTQGVDAPTQYSVKTGELHLHGISEETFVIPHTFLPGHHSIYVYNPASNIRIDGTTASVEVENGYMKSLPGWFFTSAHHLTIEGGKDYHLSTVMQQQTGELRFVMLTPEDFADKVSRIQASLNGIASQLDLPSGEVTGLPISVMLDFTRNTKTSFTASTRIAGIIGDFQLFTYHILFEDANLPEITRISDLHAVLEDFNADKVNGKVVSIEVIP
jgi:hypothetical protein